MENGERSNLHSDSTQKSDSTPIQIDRQLLIDHWGSWKCLFKFQPINEIEQYFGAKVAFYFAWIGNILRFNSLINFFCF